MHVDEAVASRFTCRAFLPTPVAEAVVRDIVARAAQAPSGGNLQPWIVHALAGEALEALRADVVPRARENPRGEGAEYTVYPPDLKEPYRTRRHAVGEMLYASLGIPRDDKAARYRQFARNAALFDAPVALFLVTDRSMGQPQWSDLGMYLQSLMLLARARGLDTCAQEYWTGWHKTLGRVLALPPEQMVFCGVGLGYADQAAPINQWRAPREPLAGFASFRGFASPV